MPAMKTLVCGILTIASLDRVSAQARASTTLVRKAERAEIYRTAAHPFVPIYSGYGLIGVRSNRTSNPTIWASSSAGIEDIEFTIPGAGQLIIWSVAASKDRTITIAGTAVGGNSQGSGFIGVIPPDRTKKLIVRTAPYFPYAITLAPDGVIWTVGWDEEEGKRVFNVLKRFDPSGRLLSSRHMTVKPMPMGLDPDVSYASKLLSSRDRVGWLTGASQYLEFSFDGSEIGRFEGPPWRSEKPVGSVLHVLIYLALSDSNEVAVAGVGPISSLWRLNRDSRKWIPVNVSGEEISQTAWLLGFDGDELMVDTEASNRGELVARFSFLPGS